MKRMIRGLALLLVLCVLLCGCDYAKLLEEIQSVQGNQNTEVSADYISFSDMVYERPDLDAFEDALRDIEARLQSKKSVAYVADGIWEFYWLYDSFYTNYTLAHIHYCMDLTDAYWTQEYNFCSENSYLADIALEDMYRMLAASDYRDNLEGNAYFGPDFFDYYDGQSYWDETLTALVEQEAQLENEYYALQNESMDAESYSEEYFTKYGSQMEELFVELIRVRQQIAEQFGYEDYVQYAYDSYYREYTPAQAEAYFVQIGQDLVGLYRSAMESDVWDVGEESCSEEQTLAYMQNAAENMGGQIADAFTLMKAAQLYDIRYSQNKYTASFEAFLDTYGEPFLFVNPSTYNVDKLALAHEFGHFASDYICGGNYAGVDVSEVYSFGMELLSTCYAENGADLEKYKVADNLCIMVEQAAFALFEQKVYGLTGEDLTTENVQKLYEEICTDFGFDSWDWDSRDYVTIPHFFTSPMYVASYVVSCDVAMQIYQMEKAQTGDGLETYLMCLESHDESILQFVETHGLENPFADGRSSCLKTTFQENLS